MWFIAVAISLFTGVKGKNTDKVWVNTLILAASFSLFSNVQSTIIMHKWGETSHRVETIHLKISVGVTETLDLIKQLFAAITRIAEREEDRHDQHGQLLLRGRCQELAARLQHLLDLKDRFFDPATGRRTKRFFVTFALIMMTTFAIAGTSLGVYNTIELQKMKETDNVLLNANLLSIEEIQSTSAKMYKLADLVRHTAIDAEKDLKYVRSTRVQEMALRAAEDRVSMMEDIYTAATDGRLHASALILGNMTRAEEEILAKAKEIGYVPMTQFGSDILQCDTSFISTGEGFDLYTHVPLSHPDAGMAIFRHQPVPIKISNNLFATLSSDHQFIAISPDRKAFKTMTTAQMKDCKRLGATWVICDDFDVVRKPLESVTEKDPGMCLYFLHAGDHEGAKTACNIQIHTIGEDVVQLSPSQFLVTSKDTHQGVKVCRNGQRTAFQVHSQTIVDLEPGCYAEVNNNFFSAGDQARNNNNSITYSWSEKHPLFPYDINADDESDNPTISALIQDIMGTDTTARLDTVLEHLRKAKVEANRGIMDWLSDQWANLMASWTTTLLFVGAAICLFWLCLGRKKKPQSVSYHPYDAQLPSAPPMYAPPKSTIISFNNPRACLQEIREELELRPVC